MPVRLLLWPQQMNPKTPVVMKLGIVLLALLLNACSLMSQNPVGSADTATVDKDLWGAWKMVTKKTTYSLQITPRDENDGKVLEIVLVGHGKRNDWYEFEGHITSLSNGYRFVNLRLVRASQPALSRLDADFPQRLEYPYAFVPYKLDHQGNLRVGIPPSRHLGEAINSGRLQGEVGTGSIRLRDSSEKIAENLLTVEYSSLFHPELPLTFVRSEAASEQPHIDSAAPASNKFANIHLRNVDGKGIQLKIPLQFLERNHRESGWRETVYFDVIFPEIRPGRLSTQQSAQEQSQAMVGGVLPYDGTLKIWPGDPQRLAASLGGLIGESSEFSENREPGFHHFRHMDSRENPIREYLVPIEELSGQTVWLSCPLSEGILSRYKCTAHSNFGDRLTIEYTIPRKTVDQWRQIDAAIRRAVQEFVVTCFDSPDFGLPPSRKTYDCPL